MVRTQRLQLNLRFDGHASILEQVRTAAKRDNLSVNAWVIKNLENAVKTGSRIIQQPIVSEELEEIVSKVVEEKLHHATQTNTEEEKATAASVNALRQELRIAYNNLALQDKELMRMYEQNRKLKLELSAEEETKALIPKTETQITRQTNPKHELHKRIQAAVAIR